ncbi:MAG TPA: DUF4397 domain-containing protein [Candidatus Baltobacteraceae bacterium]|jgi:hypothetical protein
MQRPLHHARTLVAACAAALSLVACNGSTGSILGGATNNGYIRVLMGSPDLQPVDIAIDNNVIKSSAAYGNLTTYHSASTGSHTIYLYTPGSDTGAGLYSFTMSVNAGSDVTVVVTGEKSPAPGGGPIVAETFVEQPYNTPATGGALDFHNASPFSAAALGLNQANVQFGYSINASPANNPLGTPQPVGGATNPQGLPGSATNTPITLYAVNNATVTTTPGQISPSCSNNQIPCTTPNLSLYLVDGPAASLSPTSPPPGISPTAKAAFFGAFDANGLLTQ